MVYGSSKRPGLPREDRSRRNSTVEVVGAARDGSRTAAGELVARYDPYIEACVRHFLGPDRYAADGDDVVQIVRIAVTRKIAGLRGKDRAALKAWIKRIARSKVVDWARRRRAQRRDPGAPLVRLDATGAADVISPGTTPSRHLLRAEDLEKLEAAIERVSPRYRDVLRLIYREAPALSDIASFLGKEREAARKFVERALNRLREVIDATAGGEETE